MAQSRNIALFVVLISIDQLSKYIIRTSGGFYICNQNLAFGLPYFTIIIVSGLVLTFLLYSLKFKILNLKSISNCKFQILNCYNSQNISFLLLISGAISNIIDRLYFGCVTDFIDFKIWPVFNLADIFITLGAIMLIYKNIMEQKQKD
jgi:signal peptidase II